MAMLEYRTLGFKGFSVKYSPFFDSRLAVGTGQNFGLVGNGRLHILGLTPQGIRDEKIFDTQDTISDIAWSEIHENQILVASGDGSVKLFDLSIDQFPIQVWEEHSREVFSVHWNLVGKTNFLSSSWDGSVRIFSPERGQAITVLPTHSCTYSAQFSPHDDAVVSAVSSDGNLRVWDLRTPASANNHLVLTAPIHVPARSMPGVAPGPGMPPSEALTHDWNKYRDGVIATGGVDRIIRCFDLRSINSGPYAVLPGHQYAVKKLSWSPHLSDTLLSASYDMTCRVWNDGSTTGVDKRAGRATELGAMSKHTEFCTGVDWCLFGAEGWCATTAWDERVLVWDVRSIMGG